MFTQNKLKSFQKKRNKIVNVFQKMSDDLHNLSEKVFGEILSKNNKIKDLSVEVNELTREHEEIKAQKEKIDKLI